jgi:hypothetical protein
MHSIAKLEISKAQELLERLKQAAIPAELHSAADDSGLEFSYVLVEEHYYDEACDVADASEAEWTAKARGRLRCPKCRSFRLEYFPHDKMGHIHRCRDCGAEIDFSL